MIKLLHISDVHMNAGYSNRNEHIRTRLKEAMKTTLNRAFQFAAKEGIDGIIIAGDFFDHEKISFEDENFVLEKFKNMLELGISIFYCSGNHDPMQTASFLKLLDMYENFHLYEDDQVSCTECLGQDHTHYKVVSVGHKSKNEQRNLIKTFPRKNGNDIWVGIAHASVPSALTTTDKVSYMATSLSDIESLNYDYFAMGHIHIRQMLSPKIGYSGNLQGLNIKETGLKGGYLVTISSGGTKIEPVNFNEILWEQISLEIHDDIVNLAQLQEWMIERVMPIVSISPMPSKNIVVRINLSGKTMLKNELNAVENINYLATYIKNRTGLMDVEIISKGLSNHINSDDIINENTVLSKALQTVMNNDYNEELLDRLLSLPIYDTLGSKESKIAYLQELTKGLVDEIIDRMVTEKNDN
ncbi:metallophosphoesterase family protein [Fusibacter bizertensis]